MMKKILPLALMTVLGFLIYANALNSSFQFDDFGFIADNPSIYQIHDLQAIWNKYPVRFVGTFTFALNYYFHHLNVFGYHLVNVLIHILSAFMVRWLILLLFSCPRLASERMASQKDSVALSAALLFLAHPVQIQAVTYITQRYSSLSALFYLMTLCFYIKAVSLSRENILKFSPAGFFRSAAYLAAILGIFTKQSVVTLPVMLFLAEYFFLRPTDAKKYFLQKTFLQRFLPFIFIALLIPCFYLSRSHNVFDAVFQSASHAGETITLGKYFITQFRVLVTYLRLLSFPVHVPLDFDFSLSSSFFEPAVFLSFAFLAFLAVTAFCLRKSRPLISFGIFWFFLTISVESSVIPIPHLLFGYRLYLPSVGFCIVLTVILFSLIRNFKMWACCLGIMIFTFAYLTVEHNKIWQSEITLWQDAIQRAPGKSRPYDNLAAAYLRQGDYAMALENLKKAQQIDGGHTATYINLGEAYLALDQFDWAGQSLRAALVLDPDSVMAMNNLGLVYLKQGRREDARQIFEKAVGMNSRWIEPWLNLAQLYLAEGERDRAAQLYEQILARYPHDRESLFPLIEIYLTSRQNQKAADLGKQVLKKGNDAVRLTQIGSLFAAHSFQQMSLAFFSTALQRDPLCADAYVELGKLYGNQNKFNQAIAVWQEGARLNPGDPRFKDLMARAKKLQAEFENPTSEDLSGE